MKLVRKCALATAAAVLSISAIGVLTPASAVDSSWSCGGWCKGGPTQP